MNGERLTIRGHDHRAKVTFYRGKYGVRHRRWLKYRDVHHLTAKTMKKLLTILISVLAMTGVQAQSDLPFDVAEIASFDQPWAMAHLPDGRILVTEKKGLLRVVGQDGQSFGAVRGVPDVDYFGQGGLGDVVLHPEFEDNGLVYLSYVEGGIGGTRGAAVARGVLTLTGRGGNLSDLEVVWRQYPKMVGFGHYGHRIAFDDDGYLWISSGDRQKFTPAQDMQSNIGKIVRLHDDGSIPEDNPFVDYYSEDAFVDDEGVYPEIWSLGHRNPLGMAFDLDGQLWVIEMGPRGGDELNLIKPRGNYGYPIVSNGEHYDGRPIPDHDTNPEFDEPAIWWTPVISPGHLMVYSGDVFPEWQGDLLASGLSSRAIIRIEIDGDSATEAERYPMGERIRSVVQGPEGNLWVLEDELRGSGGRLLKLTPKD
jgi:glucose/arabinose dehydrogenase